VPEAPRRPVAPTVADFFVKASLPLGSPRNFMSRDARVETAISHWAPRFISNGVLLADFQEITGRLERWEDWCAAWCVRAADHEGSGRAALEDGYYLTAGEHLSRAAVYYHFAKFMFVNDIAQMRAAHAKAIECKQFALPHLRPPGERVEIPYFGSSLAGHLRRPPGAANPPVMIMVPGLESAKEEMEAYELPFLSRGIATLMIDGPGQGEAEYEYRIRGDSEVPIAAIVDWVLTRAAAGTGPGPHTDCARHLGRQRSRSDDRHLS
jgi:Esterase FrsA-like